ncbi:DUF4367 domain-containing protein [Desulfosporosinus nitroreducens]|uniref:DUF4367 domain-containing protein n=1 Tax=Desulfosporosinus nitroreducens TaxID=2018668 RepID=UPI00207D5F66|nr:DUF4367 domain-containing protein [Desulfosporosinus nitroreducens]MCO1600860.1 DUF4367 domain-containing protein [Desulfosporosinus nitroreducens]
MTEQESAKVQAKEKILEALFEYAAACHVENIIAENPIEDDPAPDFAISPEFDRRMKKLIARHDRKETFKKTRKETVRFLPKAAIFLLVLLGSFAIVVTSVQALRVKALNIILNIQNQYTSIQTKDENNGQTKPGNEQVLPNWSGYVPNYIPPGFKIVKTEERELLNAIYYTNEQGQTIRFTQYRSSDTDLRVDTEGAIVENILIHNNDALLAEKQGLVSIVWKGEFLFSLIGEVDKAEIIKMAESISKK